MNLTEAAASGDRLAALQALRDALAARIDAGTEGAAPLAKQLADVLREIEQIAPVKQESASDALAARRAARLAKATG